MPGMQHVARGILSAGRMCKRPMSISKALIFVSLTSSMVDPSALALFNILSSISV